MVIREKHMSDVVWLLAALLQLFYSNRTFEASGRQLLLLLLLLLDFKPNQNDEVLVPNMEERDVIV